MLSVDDTDTCIDIRNAAATITDVATRPRCYEHNALLQFLIQADDTGTCSDIANATDIATDVAILAVPAATSTVRYSNLCSRLMIRTLALILRMPQIELRMLLLLRLW